MFKKWRSENIEKDLERVRKYHRDNAGIRRQYYLDNKHKIMPRQAKYQRDKAKSDPEYKLAQMLRKRVWAALKNNYADKAHKTMDILGCSIPEYREHLESLFTAGMSWDNHSPRGWHIDHIMPCAAFDLTDPKEQKKCFNYKNTQPLWAVDNLRKSAKNS
jgi:hypothetical protein